jgi:hypothetical protein
VARHRLVLIEGETREDPAIQVLREYEDGTTRSVIRAEARNVFVPANPGKVVALEHEEVKIGGSYRAWWRSEWYGKEGGWPDTNAAETAHAARKKAEEEERRLKKERRAAERKARRQR